MRILIKFQHGLGDAVQLSAVVAHLKDAHPDWRIEVAALRGKHTALKGVADAIHVIDHEPPGAEFDHVYELGWWECHESYADSPSTKVEFCLRDVFQIAPKWILCRYSLAIGDDAIRAAEGYLETIGARRGDDGRFDAVVIHYEGNTAITEKNLSHEHAKIVCDQTLAAGMLPIILDWDERSPLPDQKSVWCPRSNHSLWFNSGSGDAERIAALISLCRACVAIDSGPGHVAATTLTPTLIAWIGHHPIHYFAPAENVLHLIPETHADQIHHRSKPALKAFEDHYRHATYKTLGAGLIEQLEKLLGVPAPDALRIDERPIPDSLIRVSGVLVRRDNIEQDLVIVRDVIDNDCYRLGLIPGIVRGAKLIVDVGSHVGCFALLCHRLNPRAKIVCVEVCPENIEALTANVGHFAHVINGACTYEPGELALLNAVRPNCESTGGSTVIPAEHSSTADPQQIGYQYWLDKRPVRKVTHEELFALTGESQIGLLKLDCEGSEFSILTSPAIGAVRFVVGEYHGRERWQKFQTQNFSEWDYGHMHQTGNFGLFHLRNRETTTVAVALETSLRDCRDQITSLESQASRIAACQSIAGVL